MRGIRRGLIVTAALLLACTKGCPQKTASPTATPATPANANRVARFVLPSTLNVRREPKKDAPIDHKLGIGASVETMREENGWARVESGGVTGWVPVEMLGAERPVLADLLAKHDAATDDTERRTWAERASALDPTSLPALEHLVAALEKGGEKDAPALERAAEALAIAKGGTRALTATLAEGEEMSLLPQRPAAMGRLHDLALYKGSMWVAGEGGILVHDLTTRTWTMPWTKSGTFPQGVSLLAPAGDVMWASSRLGLYRIDLVHSRIRLFESSRFPGLTAVYAGGASAWVRATDAGGNVVLIEIDAAGDEKSRASLADVPTDDSYPILVRGDAAWVFGDDRATVYRKDLRTGAVDRIPLPHSGGYEPFWGGAKDAIYLSTGRETYRIDETTLALKALGVQSNRVRSGDGLVWVGASYDVNPSSNFVVRYIEDASKDWKNAFFFAGWTGLNDMLAVGSEIWIATTMNGVIRWKRGSKQATQYVLAATWKTDGSGTGPLEVEERKHTLERVPIEPAYDGYYEEEYDENGNPLPTPSPTPTPEPTPTVYAPDLFLRLDY